MRFLVTVQIRQEVEAVLTVDAEDEADAEQKAQATPARLFETTCEFEGEIVAVTSVDATD